MNLQGQDRTRFVRRKKSFGTLCQGTSWASQHSSNLNFFSYSVWELLTVLGNPVDFSAVTRDQMDDHLWFTTDDFQYNLL